jgi:ferredoxin/flavodoxin
MIGSFCEIYFSPTGTTRKIISAIADEIAGASGTAIDLTREAFTENQQSLIKEGVVIGVPVYGGRIPTLFISRMEGLKGNGLPAIIVVVYGNRAYEDALLELKELVAGKGFTVIAAAAFIGEHSYSSKGQPIADGRPDALDMMTAAEYGKRIKGIINSGKRGAATLKVPGNFPYKERKPSAAVGLTTDANRCIACNKCIAACPTAAIPEGNPLVTNGEKCLRCAACIKLCPVQARAFADATILGAAKWLFENCQKRNDPELYLAE